MSAGSPDPLHADALRSLRGWSAPTHAQERLRRRYVDHLERHADALTRGCFPAHLTASALVLSHDQAQVLLTLHAKAGAWFQTGGHCEVEDRTLAGAALREAVEESGVPDLVIDPRPVRLDAHTVTFCDPRGPVEHLDVQYVAVAPAGARPVTSTESDAVAWWPADAPPTDERSLLELVHHARLRISGMDGRAAGTRPIGG